MGWGQGKFPIFTQLNILTNAGHIEATREFFVSHYGEDGLKYTVGDLCHDWTMGPPWGVLADAPAHNAADANDWQDHCRTDLAVKNDGVDFDGKTTGNTVADDLTKWIRDAILSKERIIYKFHRDDEIPNKWKADRRQNDANKQVVWRITVSGPGF